MQGALRWRVLGLAATLVMLSRVALTADTPTVDPAALGALEQLFETDPATAFERAEAACLAALDKADFAQAEALVDLIEERAAGCLCLRPVERVAGAPIAEKAGNWQALGRLYGARARVLWLVAGIRGQVAMVLRADHFARLAAEAYGKAGASPEWLNGLSQSLHAYMSDLGARRAADAAAGPAMRAMGPARRAQYEAVEQAIAGGRDAEAVGGMQAILRQIVDTPAPPDQADYETIRALTLLLWVPGAEQLIPTLVDLVGVDAQHPGRTPRSAYSIVTGCIVAWSGRDDAYCKALHWANGRQQGTRDYTPIQPYQIDKFIRFRRLEEADELARAWLRWLSDGPAWASSREVSSCTMMVHEAMADEVRRAVVDIAVRCVADHPEEIAYFRSSPWEWTTVGLRAPPDKRDQWNYETAVALAAGAHSFSTSEARIFGLAQSAELFDAAKRPDLAQQCRDLAEAIAADDPAAALQCALASARRLAGEGKWEDAAAAIEGPATRQQGTVETLQAALLLQEAYLRTGKPEEAERWYQTASDLVDQLPLAPAERANYLVSMAGLCDVAMQVAETEVGGQR